MASFLPSRLVAVLQVKGKRLLYTILNKYIAEWALDQVVNVLGLVAGISIISPGFIAF